MLVAKEKMFVPRFQRSHLSNQLFFEASGFEIEFLTSLTLQKLKKIPVSKRTLFLFEETNKNNVESRFKCLPAAFQRIFRQE